MEPHGHLDTCLELGGETGWMELRDGCRGRRLRPGGSADLRGEGWVGDELWRSADGPESQGETRVTRSMERTGAPFRSLMTLVFLNVYVLANASVPFLPSMPAIFLHILGPTIPHHFLYEAWSEFPPEITTTSSEQPRT